MVIKAGFQQVENLVFDPPQTTNTGMRIEFLLFMEVMDTPPSDLIAHIILSIYIYNVQNVLHN